MYDTVLLTGLVIAVLTNLYSIRSMSLCFLAIGFLLLLPHLIPLSIQTSEYAFLANGLLDGFFALCALLTQAPVRKFIALVCFYNVICHFTAWVCYTTGSTLYNSYQFWLRTGEVAQVAALIIGSRPVTAFIVAAHLNCLDKEDTHGHRFSASSR